MKLFANIYLYISNSIWVFIDCSPGIPQQLQSQISSWTEVKRHTACSARVPRTGSETWHHLYGPLEWDCWDWTWECCANEIDMSIYIIYVICSSSILIKASNLFQWSSVRISSSVCQPSLINIFTFCLRDTTTVNSLTNLSWPHALRHKK